jgi:hypothetical protein
MLPPIRTTSSYIAGYKVKQTVFLEKSMRSQIARAKRQNTRAEAENAGDDWITRKMHKIA